MNENEEDRGTLPLQDEDRLPWLEAVDDKADDEVISTGKLVALGFAAVAAIGITIGGVSLLRSNQPPPKGDGKLITAAEGEYKVHPGAPGGMKVEGQGDSAFAASEGAEANGKIDLNAGPETPVAGTKQANVKPGFSTTPAKPVATAAVPVSGGKLVATPPAKPVTTALKSATAGGSLVQLGAFNSEALANGEWTSLAKRFAYLAPLNKSVERAEVNGRTVYRLRADAGTDAGTVCGKLKVAGELCLVVN